MCFVIEIRYVVVVTGISIKLAVEICVVGLILSFDLVTGRCPRI